MSLQKEFCLLLYAWEKEEGCYVLEVVLDETKVVFAVLVLLVQQAKLTKFQIIFDGVGFFFPFSVLSLAKVKELTCSGLI